MHTQQIENAYLFWKRHFPDIHIPPPAGGKLKTARRALQLSMVNVAKRLHITRAAYSIGCGLTHEFRRAQGWAER